MNRYTIPIITALLIAVLLTGTTSFAREKNNITVSENQFNINNYLLTLKDKKMTDTMNVVTTRIFDASPGAGMESVEQ